MASPNTLTKATGSTLLLKLLFRSNPSRAMFAPFTPRSIHTVDTKLPKSDYDDDEATRGCGTYAKNNPFQSLGPRGAYVTKESEEGMYVRVDMPGVGKDGMRVWVENDSVFFEAKGSKEEHEQSGRNYNGSFICFTDTYNLNEVKATLKNGVLRMMIPKKLEEKEVD